jgi:hypothetical protein
MIRTAINQPRTRKCKICRTAFLLRSITHKACGPDCAATIAVTERERAERKETKARREAMKSRSAWLRDAQHAFNAYIRARDQQLPCVSCGRYTKAQRHAGHYLSVGSNPELRFHEDNVNSQCAHCNLHKSGNAVVYRMGLIAKIGIERVELLEGPHEPKKYSIEEAKAIRALYKAKLKEINAAFFIEAIAP